MRPALLGKRGWKSDATDRQRISRRRGSCWGKWAAKLIRGRQNRHAGNELIGFAIFVADRTNVDRSADNGHWHEYRGFAILVSRLFVVLPFLSRSNGSRTGAKRELSNRYVRVACKNPDWPGSDRTRRQRHFVAFANGAVFAAGTIRVPSGRQISGN